VRVISARRNRFDISNHPHPSPLPVYRERGQGPPIVTLESYTRDHFTL
jgi:hypothetical protein